MLKRKEVRTRLVIALGIFALCFGITRLPVWQGVSGRAFDVISTLGQPAPEEAGSIIIAIDEASFSAIGQPWPWPRDLHARLIRSLRQAGAKAIAFDIVFAEPSDPEADAALAQASDSRTVFAADESLMESAHASGIVRTNPFPALLEKGARAGVTAVSLDPDGVARRISRYPDSFPRAFLEASGAGSKTKVPDKDLMIQYFGPAGTYPQVSYYQALEPSQYLPPGFFQGRNVIVGFALQATADVQAGTDRFETPYTMRTGQLTPGVEIQATVADNLRSGLAISAAPEWLASILLLMGAWLGYIASKPNRPLLKLAASIAILGAVVAASWLALRFGRFWVSPADPALSVLATVVGLSALDFSVEQRRRREVQGAFSQYVSPDVVQRLVADPSLLRLGGERKEMTILFADIRGFTTLSEAMKGDPEGLTRVINDLLTPLSDIVIEHGGTIDKYMGDCIMAFWNAPLDDPDHASNGVRAGIAMIESMPTINGKLQDLLPGEPGAKPVLKIGVGVNSGECVVGNMGSAQRFDYSVLGDCVNVASRIEGLSKELGVPMVVGQETVRLASSSFDFIELDRIVVRGKTEPLALFGIEHFGKGGAA